MSQVLKESMYTSFAEFEAMEKQERFQYELCDGMVLMSPRPSLRHSEVASRLLTLLNIPFLKGKECLAYSEADIRYKDTCLVPDVSLRCVGQELPLIVFEVLSPGNRRYDLLVKPSAYQSLGILEYWIIDPEEEAVLVYNLMNADAQVKTYHSGQIIQSNVKPEITIPVDEIFETLI